MSKFIIKEKIGALLPKNSSFRGVSVLAGGAASSQILIMLASPVLTRLYSPENFGLLAVYSAIIAIATVFASLRYEMAIPLPESESEALDIVRICFFLLFGVVICLFIPVVFFSEDISGFLGVEELVKYLWLVPIGLFFTGGYQILNYWAVRRREFSLVAKTRVQQSGSSITIQVLASSFGGAGLLLGQILGQSIGAASLARPFLREFGGKKANSKKIRDVAVKYRKFPQFSLWGAFLNSLGQQLPPLLFATLFSPMIAGFYVLANRVLATPMSTIGQAVANVFLSDASKARRRGELGGLVDKILPLLFFIALPPIFILMISGPRIFSVIFGDQWIESGYIARWLAPWILFVFITSPLSSVYEVMGKQKVGMFFQVCLFLARTVAILAGSLKGSLWLAVGLFSGLSVICWLFLLLWIVKASGASEVFIIRKVLLALIFSLFSVAPLIVSETLFLSNWAWSGTLIASSFIIFWGYLIMYKKVFR